jgi:hypothetical protein
MECSERDNTTHHFELSLLPRTILVTLGGTPTLALRVKSCGGLTFEEGHAFPGHLACRRALIEERTNANSKLEQAATWPKSIYGDVHLQRVFSPHSNSTFEKLLEKTSL